MSKIPKYWNSAKKYLSKKDKMNKIILSIGAPEQGSFKIRALAQDNNSMFGKIIEINKTDIDRVIANEESNLSLKIFSTGHRNPQGLTKINDSFFSVEHGPLGGDELNKLIKDKNYGWPAITYGLDYSGAIISPFKKKDGMEQPVKYWVPSIAPSGMTFYDGDLFSDWRNSLFISALVPGDVRRLSVDGDKILSEEILFDTEGRIRNIVSAPDGSLVLATDSPKGKLIRVVPNN